MSEDETQSKYTPEIEFQTRIRIRLAMAAYAYEFNDRPIMDDAEFDTLARQVDVSISTRRPDLDEFFRKEFSHSTGNWIHRHPDLYIIAAMVNKYFK